MLLILFSIYYANKLFYIKPSIISEKLHILLDKFKETCLPYVEEANFITLRSYQIYIINLNRAFMNFSFIFFFLACAENREPSIGIYSKSQLDKEALAQRNPQPATLFFIKLIFVLNRYRELRYLYLIIYSSCIHSRF